MLSLRLVKAGSNIHSGRCHPSTATGSPMFWVSIDPAPLPLHKADPLVAMTRSGSALF